MSKFQKFATAGAMFILAAGAYFFGFGGTPSDRRIIVRIGDLEFHAEAADTAFLRAKGLSGRAGLREREGMYFTFGKEGRYGFWMYDMKFPIDIIWIRGGKIVGFSENLDPQIGEGVAALRVYYPPETADAVFEVGAGVVAAMGLTIGEAVAIESH